MTDRLADRIRAAVAAPSTDDAFDIDAQLTDVLAELGMRPADTGGAIRFTGADPVVPSTLRLAGASSIALAAKSASVAKLWRMRGGDGQDIDIDIRPTPHRLCPFYDYRWELLNGYPPLNAGMPSNALGFRFYPTRDGRWTMPLNPYPKLRIAAQKLLGVPDDTKAVATAIAGWDAAELEQASIDAGVVMPMLRTPDEMLATEQYREAIAGTPLVEIERIGDSAPEPLTAGADQPLSGVRALGMGHVVAGAGAGRSLALHGADVLNVWRPDEYEPDVTYATANVGMRSCLIHPRQGDGAARLHALSADADVFFANRRPGYLDSIGMGVEELAARRPGIVHATVSLAGTSGPWADRVGFDQTAGSLVGMMGLEGGGTPALPPILVVNDYIVSWLLAAGITEALARRAEHGGSYRVHVSLTRVALWILSLGVFDLDYAKQIAGTPGAHEYLDPETFTADTPMGRYQGVTDQVRMSATPGRYSPILIPRGSSGAVWL